MVEPGDIFTAMDRDGDGVVTLEEMEVGLRRLDLPISLDVLRNFMRLFALDGAGGITRHEFLTQVSTTHPLAAFNLLFFKQ